MLIQKTHDVLPMEDPSLIENQSVKYDCSLFAVGSHQKKRPDNLTIGRMYDGHVLDEFEFGIQSFKGIKQFAPPQHVQSDDKPIMIFQGEPFENSEKHKRMKNLLIDLFHQRNIKEANIVAMHRVMLFTCRGESDPI